jgi:anti-sigma factor RsiW
MDCALTQGRLVEYHFATLEEADRQAVEEHLVVCTGCLRTYLALKAHADRAGASGPSTAGEMPSDAARERLRAAVAARFRPTPARRVRRWLSRPVPFYQGLAVAAVVAIAAALAPTLARSVRSTAAHPAERVDTARPTAQSLTIY